MTSKKPNQKNKDRSEKHPRIRRKLRRVYSNEANGFLEKITL